MSPLSSIYGKLVLVRTPAPANVNKAGANYKSEVSHTTYSPRRAFDEWLAICEAVVSCGGDALFQLEEADEALLDTSTLSIDGDGDIYPRGSTTKLANLDDVLTGRVFTANGPWVVTNDAKLTAVMPNMLAHRREEAPYYCQLLAEIAAQAGQTLEVIATPHRWEGMADVTVIGDRVILTYAVAGHYDAGLPPKSPRSSREGVAFAADAVGVPDQARIYAELVYPHFHGDTVHFCARPPNRSPVLVQYPDGLWGDGADRIARALGTPAICSVSREDAIAHYATNSRQIGSGVLVPDSASSQFSSSMEELGLELYPLALSELFGKAGGGPACATLYLPAHLPVPQSSPLRFSVSRERALSHRARIPTSVEVAHEYFAGRTRG